MLTDSGGFQMVSLLKLAEITEDGVKFQSPFGGKKTLTINIKINYLQSMSAC